MIPVRYREVLPPYWYENEVAGWHFGVMEEEIDLREKKMNELVDQFYFSGRPGGWASGNGFISGRIRSERLQNAEKRFGGSVWPRNHSNFRSFGSSVHNMENSYR